MCMWPVAEESCCSTPGRSRQRILAPLWGTDMQGGFAQHLNQHSWQTSQAQTIAWHVQQLVMTFLAQIMKPEAPTLL